MDIPPTKEQDKICYIKLTIPKDFAWFHWQKSRRLPYKRFGKNDGSFLEPLHTESINELFGGGLWGDDFTSLGKLNSFNNAFNQLLSDSGIPIECKHELLYLSLFYQVDIENQSAENNFNAQVEENADLLLNIIYNCNLHRLNMEQNELYEGRYVEDVDEYMFINKDILISDDVDIDALDTNSKDLVRYRSVKLYQYTLYVPQDFVFHIINRKDLDTLNRNCKNLRQERLRAKDVQTNGKPKQKLAKQEIDIAELVTIDLPTHLQREMLEYIIASITKSLKDALHPLYFALLNGDNKQDIYSLYNQRRSRKTSHTKALTVVGCLLIDYLNAQAFFKNKTRLMSFIYDYFALLKAFPKPDGLQFPKNYKSLRDFYTTNRIKNEEDIRLMFKGYLYKPGIKRYKPKTSNNNKQPS